MKADRARAYYQKLKNADQATLDQIFAQFPDAAKDPTLRSLQKKIVESLTEEEFVKWAGDSFSPKKMPTVKLRPEEMQALSGGTYSSYIELGGDNIGRYDRRDFRDRSGNMASIDPGTGNGTAVASVSTPTMTRMDPGSGMA